MKFSALVLCLFCIAVTANAQETQRTQVPPIRNTDNVKPALQTTAPAVPVLNAGNAPSAAKTVSPVPAVPIRKSDIANTVQPATTGAKTTESRLAVPDSLQPPSYISARQALELRQKQDAAKKPAQ